jgi:hypothetical protein
MRHLRFEVECQMKFVKDSHYTLDGGPRTVQEHVWGPI